MPVTPLATPYSTVGQPKGGNSSMASDFNAFLTLLTTQLANQDPLSPMDSNQFTQQLVQFAGVEQAVNTNTKLDQMLEALDSARLGIGAQYLGQEVLADGRTMELAKQGSTSFTMDMPEPGFALVHIYDADGRPVTTIEHKGPKGPQTVLWNGSVEGNDGFRAPAGRYRVEVEAYNKVGDPMSVETGFFGVVNAVEAEGQNLFLHLAGRRVPIDDVEAVRPPPPPVDAPSTDSPEDEETSS